MTSVTEFHLEESHEFNHKSGDYESIKINSKFQFPNKYIIKINIEEKIIEEQKITALNYDKPRIRISKRITEDGSLHDFFGNRNSPYDLVKYATRETVNNTIEKALDWIDLKENEISWGWSWKNYPNSYEEKKTLNLKSGELRNDGIYKGKLFIARHKFLNKTEYKFLRNTNYGDKVVFLNNSQWNQIKRERTI